MQQQSPRPVIKNPLLRFLVDLIRGSLIGIAEIIPGVSGGTVALITGVYTRVINSAAEAVRGFVLLLSFSKVKWLEAGIRFRAISWSLLVPLLIGMLVAIFVGASLVEPLLEQYPTLTRALFAGLIAASLWVPISLSGGRWGIKQYLVALIAAGFALGLTSIPKAEDADPSFLVVVLSAALAVCALVLPGVSGSYLLLAMGMYSPTLQAVNERDFGYLGVFVLGAILGLGSFVALLQWLLANHRRITLVVMTGLMVGSLRALWPWQSETGALLQPSQNVLPELGLAAMGVAVVVSLVLLEKKLTTSVE
jgi:putative membrane protein